MLEARRVLDVAELRVGVRRPGWKARPEQHPDNQTSHATILHSFLQGTDP
jgi:hypothetical protein